MRYIYNVLYMELVSVDLFRVELVRLTCSRYKIASYVFYVMNWIHANIAIILFNKMEKSTFCEPL